MPILSSVGRRSRPQAAARVLFYTLLTVGALCIVYPLLLVLGQAMSDRYDLRDNTIVPRYLFDSNELALKHVFSYTTRLNLLASRHHRNRWTTHPNMREDATFLADQPGVFAGQGLSLEAADAVLRDLSAFKRRLPPCELLVKQFRMEDLYRPFLRERFGRPARAVAGGVRSGGAEPDWLVKMVPDAKQRRAILRSHSRLAVALMNHEFRSDYPNLHSVEVMPPGNLTVPVWRPRRDAKTRMWHDFVRSLPPERTWIVNSDTYWHDFLRRRYSKIQDLNERWGTAHQGFYEIRFPFLPPAAGAHRTDWEEFVLKRWPRRLLEVPPAYSPQWREGLRKRMTARVARDGAAARRPLEELNRLTGSSFTSWEEVTLPRARPQNDTMSRLWCEFVAGGVIPAHEMTLLAPERQFRVFLARRYGDGRDGGRALQALNRAWETSFASFDDVPLPLELSDYVEPACRPAALRWQHAVESFQRVFEYLIGRGRAVQNTIILVLLSLCSALTINPIAAYSLSRFTMKQAHKILLFFLATMAFPVEVTMIPNFLLLRDLGLLNTYAALVLPRMANGFSIFLLKCFFDSLPQELYEAAEIDGASEAQVFRMVALPMLKPILAYIALNAFVLTYGGFMWAFVICPDQKMWTVMVWVFDFQSRNTGANYVMASVLLVSIPPLVVFLFANRIIMRGIIIPSMK